MLKINKEHVESISISSNDGLDFLALRRDATGFIEITNRSDSQKIEISPEVLKEIYKWATEISESKISNCNCK